MAALAIVVGCIMTALLVPLITSSIRPHQSLRASRLERVKKIPSRRIDQGELASILKDDRNIARRLLRKLVVGFSAQSLAVLCNVVDRHFLPVSTKAVVLSQAVLLAATFSFVSGYLDYALSTAIVCYGVAGAAVLVLLAYCKKAGQLRDFKAAFPDALDLIVRCVRAGLPVSEAIRLIGSEAADPVGALFTEVGANISIGLSIDQALASLERVIPTPEVKFFIVSVALQQETGGNLSEILSNLSATMRRRAQMEKKIRALSSEAKASALIIGALPFVVGLVIGLMNKEYISTLFTDETGQILLMCSAASMSIGAIAMYKMIDFEI